MVNKVRKNDIAVIDNPLTKGTKYVQVGELTIPYGILTTDNKVIATEYPTLITIVNKQKAQIEKLELDNSKLTSCLISLLEAVNQLNGIVGTNVVDTSQIKRILNNK